MQQRQARRKTKTRNQLTHISVLKEKILEYAPKNIEILIDLTLGGAGHSLALLKNYPHLQIFGVDRDIQAIEGSKILLSKFQKQVNYLHMNYSEAINLLQNKGIYADYIIADLGVSSPQLDSAERGFSFKNSGPLDMRMNQQDSLSAKILVNGFLPADLVQILRKYGEETFAKRIVNALVEKRKNAPIKKTHELAEIIANAIPRRFHPKKVHPATKTFQGLRIFVNQELPELEKLMKRAMHLIKSHGRIGIITFHSLEDRIVKHQFRKWQSPCDCPKDIPLCICGKVPIAITCTKKPVVADPSEIAVNPRSRSAKLRVAEKI